MPLMFELLLLRQVARGLCIILDLRGGVRLAVAVGIIAYIAVGGGRPGGLFLLSVEFKADEVLPGFPGVDVRQGFDGAWIWWRRGDDVGEVVDGPVGGGDGVEADVLGAGVVAATRIASGEDRLRGHDGCLGPPLV